MKQGKTLVVTSIVGFLCILLSLPFYSCSRDAKKKSTAGSGMKQADTKSSDDTGQRRRMTREDGKDMDRRDREFSEQAARDEAAARADRDQKELLAKSENRPVKGKTGTRKRNQGMSKPGAEDYGAELEVTTRSDDEIDFETEMTELEQTLNELELSGDSDSKTEQDNIRFELEIFKNLNELKNGNNQSMTESEEILTHLLGKNFGREYSKYYDYWKDNKNQILSKRNSSGK